MTNQIRFQIFNTDWQFHLGDQEGAQSPSFDSTKWRTLTVPHDWSIEQSYTQENAGGAGAFLPGGIGWYRKAFKMSKSGKDQLTWIEFDGIYNNAEVWINGQRLGMHKSESHLANTPKLGCRAFFNIGVRNR
ncbi:hypothetical protein OAN72_00960 [bacterium]|nr:hypothetical protein [bacterium]